MQRYSAYLRCIISLFQFMHPRGMQQATSIITAGVNTISIHVSIHAPSDGRNRNNMYQNIHMAISIHAPAMGATARFRYYLAIYTTFSI